VKKCVEQVIGKSLNHETRHAYKNEVVSLCKFAKTMPKIAMTIG